LENLRNALGSMRSTREQIRATESAYRRAVKCIESGASIGDALDAITADAVRIDLNRVLDELERSRHLARLSMIAAGLDEGLSIGEVGRRMGFSRQLAARYAKEARGAAS